MLHLFQGQWSDGMLPHIIFNPSVAPGAYFPGPDVWRSDECDRAPKGVATSGITQPPMHAWAALEMHRRSGDIDASIAFLMALFPKLVALHDYIAGPRGGSEGLAAFVHPWESGLDNSPSWDEALGRVHIPEGGVPKYHRTDVHHGDPRDRPSDEEYVRYVYLLARLKEHGYDASDVDATPFRVFDPMFNSIWARSAVSLAEIADLIGQDGARFREDAARTTAAIEARMWSEKHSRFACIDALTGMPADTHSIVSFMPVLAPGLSSSYGARTAEVLHAFHRRYGKDRVYIVPSYALSASDFDERKYWRGPVWANTNWLLYQGAMQHEAIKLAAELRRAVVELVGAFGFREYFDPRGTAAYGAANFSWTAALYLDLMAETPT